MFQSSRLVVFWVLIVSCVSQNVIAHDDTVIQNPTVTEKTYTYDQRPYIVLSGIGGHLNFDSSSFYSNTLDSDQSSVGSEISFGQRFSQEFGFEFGFAYLGNYKLSDNFIYSNNNQVTPTSIEINFLYYLPFGSKHGFSPSPQRIESYVKAGYANCNEYNLELFDLCDRAYLNLALGLDYRLNSNVTVRLEAQSYLSDFYSARLAFLFRGEFVEALLKIISIGLYVLVEIRL